MSEGEKREFKRYRTFRSFLEHVASNAGTSHVNGGLYESSCDWRSSFDGGDRYAILAREPDGIHLRFKGPSAPDQTTVDPDADGEADRVAKSIRDYINGDN